MSKITSFLAGIILFLSVCQALAAHHGNSGALAVGNCPYSGAGYADGCLTAPHVGLFQDATFFSNTANFNGRTVVRPPWNVAGVDYGVGQYTADGGLADPISSPPSGCTPTGAHYLNCSGSGALTISGYLFNDVCLEIGGSHSSFTFTNNHVIVGTNVNDTQCGLGTPQQFWAILFDDQASSIDDEFNTYDMANFSGAGSAAFFEDERSTPNSNAHTTKHWYNYSPNNLSKMVIIDNCGDQDFRFNALMGWPAPSGDGQHAEISINCLVTNGTVNNFTSVFNTAFLSATQDNTEQTSCGGATAIDYVTSGQSLNVTYTNVTDSNNTYVADENNNFATCDHSKVQISSPIDLQTSIYTNLTVRDNFIFPMGSFHCFNNDGGTITNLTMSGNINMYDNSAIPNTMSDPTCNGHGN